MGLGGFVQAAFSYQAANPAPSFEMGQISPELWPNFQLGIELGRADEKMQQRPQVKLTRSAGVVKE